MKEQILETLNKIKEEKRIIIAIIVTAAALVLFYLLYLFRNMWPIYMLAMFWIYILKISEEKRNITVAIAVTALFVFGTHVWATIIAANLAPQGEVFDVFKQWAGQFINTVWFMFTGYGEKILGEEVRSAWATQQIWALPAIFFIYYGVTSYLNAKDKEQKEAHGTAKFENPKNVGLNIHKEGFLLGRAKNHISGNEVVLPKGEVNEHILINGSPGAGKTASLFIPNLLRIAEHGGYANLVITDPKMEELSICGPILKEQGYKVLIFHPYEPEISSGWNMLYYAADWEKVDDMVLALINNTNAGGKSDLFWEQQSNTLLNLICYHLRSMLGDRATLNHVQALAGSAKPADIQETLRNSPDPKIRTPAIGYFSRIGENEKIISSIMSDLPRRLKLWTLDPIRATTSKNEINFEDLCSDQKVALFVVTPQDKKEQLKPLFATFFGQLFKTVQEKGRELGKLPRPLWFLLDEAGNLGHIPNFTNFLTVVRGYGVGITLGIQSRSQLVELYGPQEAETIVNSCSTYLVSPRIGQEDAEFYSKMMGETTRIGTDKTYTRDYMVHMKHKEKVQTQKRRLMNPDEIRRLSIKDNLIVMAGTRQPVKVKPSWYYKDKRKHWRELGKECKDEKNQQKRREIFLRRNMNIEPLQAPTEDQMMKEAALVATGEAINEHTGYSSDNTSNNNNNKPNNEQPPSGPPPEQIELTDENAKKNNNTKENEDKEKATEQKNNQPMHSEKTIEAQQEEQKGNTQTGAVQEKSNPLDPSKYKVKQQKIEKGDPFEGK